MMKQPNLHPAVAWLVGIVVSLALLFWPGSYLLFVIAMSLGFTSYSAVTKLAVVCVALSIIATIAYLLARSVKNGLARR